MGASSTVKWLLVAAFAIAVLAGGRRSHAAAPDFDIRLPLGISSETWNYYLPADNPMSPAKVALGKALFFEKRLSDDGTVACATCHNPRYAFTDGKALAEGVRGRRGIRSAPTILNAMFSSALFWDGRADSLESQALLPLVNPNEMGNQTHDEIAARLKSIPDYQERFKEAFGEEVSIGGVGKAIAAFERTLISGNSPFDRFSAGDRLALSDAARRGMFLFTGKARCTICHNFNAPFAALQSQPFFSDQMFHNTGVAAADPDYPALAEQATALAKRGAPRAELDELARRKGAASLGRFLVTGNLLDIGAYKTPTLRDVELTAPYFHDGSAATLADVVRFYVKGGRQNPNQDWQLQPVGLTALEQADLVEFLKSLTSDDTRRMVSESQP